MTEAPVRVMIEIDNLAIAGGRKLYLVRDEATNRHALARMLPGASEILQLESKWIDHARMTEFAYRVAAGDSQAITRPGALQAFAIVLLAAAAIAEEMNAGATGASSSEVRDGPAKDAAPRGQGMLQLDEISADASRTTLDDASAARSRGFTGDICVMCSNFTMKRNGTCLVCETCGATNGCS